MGVLLILRVKQREINKNNMNSFEATSQYVNIRSHI